jgi:dTMP kinase
MARGRYIVLEGPKGVGKTTQALMLESALKSARIPVILISEDDDQNDISLQSIEALVTDANHPLSNRTKLLLHNAARSRSLDLIRSHVEDGVVCIADQNYLSTLTMQYYGLHSIDNYDNFNQIINFANHNIEPDVTIILDAEVANLAERISAYASAEATKVYDESLLERLRAGYLWEAKERGYQIIYAIGSKDEVFNSIWNYITENLIAESNSPLTAIKTPVHITSVGEILEQRSTNNHQTSTLTDSKPALENSQLPNQASTPTVPVVKLPNYQEILSRIITNVKGNVYAFKAALYPETVSHLVSYAVTKRTAIRSVLLNEYCAADKESRRKLLNEAQTKDQQKTLSTIGRFMVIEQISNLATYYLEQSEIKVCYCFSPEEYPSMAKSQSLKNNFYVPAGLDSKTKEQYQQSIKQVIKLRSKIIKQLVDYSAKGLTNRSRNTKSNNPSKQLALATKLTKPLIPVAAYNSVVLYAPINSYKELINLLTLESLPELRTLAKHLNQELQILELENINALVKPQPAEFKLTPASQGRIVNLTSKYLPNIKADTDSPLTLIQYSPRNEINLIEELIYKQSDNSAITLKKALGALTYEKKLELFNLTIQSTMAESKFGNSILEKINYEFDAISDYGTINELLRRQLVRQVDWQDLTPRHGFAVPNLIDQADAIDDFEQAFNTMLNLYCSLQPKNFIIAQYATLLGHKQRVKVVFNGQDVLKIAERLKDSESYPGTHELLNQILTKISEVHPLLIEHINSHLS